MLIRLLGTAALILGASAAQAGGTLSAAELYDCASLSLAVQQDSVRHAATAGRFAAMRAAIAREAAAIAAARAGIDRRDGQQVAMYNDRVARACAEHDAYVIAVNTAVADENIHATSFNATCADRDFDPLTVASLPPTLRTAWNAASGASTETETAALLASDLPPMPQPKSN